MSYPLTPQSRCDLKKAYALEINSNATNQSDQMQHLVAVQTLQPLNQDSKYTNEHLKINNHALHKTNSRSQIIDLTMKSHKSHRSYSASNLDLHENTAFLLDEQY